MARKNVYIVTPQYGYDKLFLENGWGVVSSMDNADLVLFTGGEDVSPSMYGERKHPKTHANIDRDEYEYEEFCRAVEKDIPCVGICRGGQFLNVVNGGAMYQHVEEHCMAHRLTDVATGKEYKVSSTHHQMMRPASVGAVVVAEAYENGGKEWMIGNDICKTFAGPDVEVVWYASTLSLCFQPHPEFSGYNECSEYFFELIKRYIKL
jgi:carbamoylphosphate synthase small subunit